MPKLTHLPDRGILEIAGPDRVNFLQGLVSNDVTKATPGHAVWAALLTPQGKWLADFFILADQDRLLLDCERNQAADLIRRLTRFRLRAEITATDLSDSLLVHVGWDGTPENTGPNPIAQAPDPRHPAAGNRMITDALLSTNASPSDWDAHRLSLGLPDGTRDLEPEKTVLLEAGFDELSGVSWTKGCYLGQELTARTKYRGLVKRRLIPVTFSGTAPLPGTAITQNGQEVGKMRSVNGPHGLALLRIDCLDGELQCDAISVVPSIPAWMNIPASRQ